MLSQVVIQFGRGGSYVTTGTYPLLFKPPSVLTSSGGHFWRTSAHFLWGHWYPFFGLLVPSVLGFKASRVILTHVLAQAQALVGLEYSI